MELTKVVKTEWGAANFPYLIPSVDVHTNSFYVIPFYELLNSV